MDAAEDQPLGKGRWSDDPGPGRAEAPKGRPSQASCRLKVNENSGWPEIVGVKAYERAARCREMVA
jgi:hypothetical protein